jgi:FkbM family methyltransferase
MSIVPVQNSSTDRVGERAGDAAAKMPEPFTQPYRVAVVFPRAQPYFSKFFQRLAAHPEIDLTVYFYSEVGMGKEFDSGYQLPVKWDGDIWRGYEYRFPRNFSPWPNLARFAGTFHPSLLWELSRRRYDIVVMQGWWGMTTMLTLAALFLRRMPVLMYSDKSTFDWSAGWRRRLRNHMLRVIFARVRAFLTIGRRNSAFYRSLGAPDGKMFMTPLAVDNDFFLAERRRLSPQRAALRKQYGIPEDAVVLLFAGRLVPWKGIAHLILAFATLREESAHLVIAGDGPSRHELEGLVKSRNIPRVHFLGFQNYLQVPACYVASDVFVLPSYRESWGCVISEAMNFSLPIVASRDGGAVDDLVEDGGNGLLFDYGNVEQLAERLSYLAASPEARRKMGEKSATVVADWNFDKGVEGFVAALHFVQSQHHSGLPGEPARGPAPVISGRWRRLPMDILKNISYSPLVIRSARTLGLSNVLRKVYYVWARPRDGIMPVKLGEFDCRFQVRTPEHLRIIGKAGSGRWRLEVTEFLGRELRDGDVVYDVGSNIGVFSVFAARRVGPRGRVIAFEPEPKTYEYLNDNFRLNGVASARAFQVALGDYKGEGGLHTGDERLFSSLVAAREGQNRTEAVRVVVGDRFREEESLPAPNVVLIDVEGFEYAALSGLRRTLSDPACRAVIAEIHPTLLPPGVTGDQVMELLRSCGLEKINTLRWPGLPEFYAIAVREAA